MNQYEKVKAWRKANPDKVLEQARRYRAKHPETNKRAKAKYRASNAEFIRETDKLRHAHQRKLDPTGQQARNKRYLERQLAEKERLAGRPKPVQCELCGPLTSGQICFDHCHATDRFRGWLCDRCNRVLGIVKDSPALLRKLADYLER